MSDRTISFTMRAEYDQAVKGLEKVSKSAGEAGKAVEKASDQMQAASRRQADAAGQLKVAETRLQEVKRKNADDSSKVAAAEEAVARARRANDEATRRATLAEQAYGRAAEEAARQQEAASSKVGKFRTELNTLTTAATKYKSEMSAVGGIMATFGGATVAGLGLATKAAMSWESAWTGVLKTVNGTPQQLNEIEGGLRGLARTLPASHEQIAAVAEAAGQLGIKTQNVVSFTKTMIDMGESTNLSADEAATSLSRFMNIMGTSQDNVGRLGASIVGLGNNFATTESEIMEMAMRIAGAGKQARMSEGDVMGMAAALSSVGIDAEAGGTAISTIMKKMGNAVSDGGDDVAAFAKVAGMSASEFQTAWENDAAGAMDKFIIGLGKADAAGQNTNSILSDLGIKGIRESDALLRLSASSDTLTKSLKMGNEEYKKGTALAEEAAKRYGTAESKIRIAGNSIKDAAIDIGGTFAPMVATATEGIAKLATGFAALPGPVKGVASVIGALAGGFATVAGGALIVIPRLAETWGHIQKLNDAAKAGELSKFGDVILGVGGKLGKLAKGAAVAGTAMAALALASDPLSDWTNNSFVTATGDNAEALQKFAGEAATSAIAIDTLNKSFSDLKGLDNEATAFKDALEGVFNPGFWGNAENIFDNFFNTFGFSLKSTTEEARDRFGQMGEQIATLATNDAPAATESFKRMVSATDGSQESIERLIDLMPAYKDQLTQQATAMGKSTDNTTLAKIAMGEYAPKAEGAADKTKAVGDAAHDAADGLKDMLDGLVAAGLANLNERDSVRQYQQAIDDFTDSVKKNGSSLDETTEKGRKNQEALDGIAKAGIDVAESMVKNGASQEEVQGQLYKTREQLIKAYKQMGIGSKKAEDLADDLLQIKSRDLHVYLDMKDAKDKEKELKAKLEKLGKMKPSPKVKADTEEAKKKLEELQSIMQFIRDHPNLHVDVDAAMSDEIKAPTVRRAGPMKKADGGAIFGPGTGTSDSVPAMLSTGEHVWTAREVSAAGGHERVEGLRALALSGGLRYAKGGAVSNAEKRVSSLQSELTRLRRAKADAKKGDKAVYTRRIRNAEDDLKAARAGLKSAKASESAAKKAEAERKKREQEEKERRARVSDLKRETRTDLRRGNYRDQVTSGLSGAYSVVDRLGDLSRNKDMSKGQRRTAGAASSKYETSLRRLYDTQSKLEKSQERASANVEKANKRLDKANDKLSKAKSHLEDMQSIQKGVSDNLLKDRTIDFGDYDRMEGGQWKHSSGVAGATQRLNVNTAALRTFAQKMNKLQKAGMPLELLQDIASAGAEEGNKLADAFLSASKSEQTEYLGAWKSNQKYADLAGKYVTNAASPGGLDKAQADVSAAQSKVNAEKIGVATAEGIVKGLEKQQKSITKAVEKIAKSIDKTFRKTLGIHSPSTVLTDAGMWTGQGAIDGLLSMLAGAEDASQQLANAMVPDLSSMSFSAPTMTAPVAADSMSSGSSSGGTGMPDVTAGAAGAAGGDEATQAVLDAEQVVRDAYAAMTATTTDGMTTMQSAVNSSMLAMLADTQTNQDGMQSKTKGALDSMSALTAARYESMRATTADKLARMRDDTTVKQESMRATVSDKTERMRATSSEKFESMRSTGSEKSDKLRSSVTSHIGSMRDTVSGHVASMRSHSNTGFDRMESHGKAAAKGLREGADAQMGHMPGEAGNNLNRVLGIFGKFASSINGSFGEVGVKLNSPAKLKYASGTAQVLPGYSPGYDNYEFVSTDGRYRMGLGGGEGIARPEVVKGMGRAQWDELNAVGKKKGAKGVREYLSIGGENLGDFKDGGALNPRIPKAQAWAQEQERKRNGANRYMMGGVGPTYYDCSGFMSAIANILLGQPIHRRRFATGMMGANGGGGFLPGEKSAFVIGVRHGNPGHTAGTLAGLNVESHGGTGAVTGSRARSATDRMFTKRYYLPQAGGEFIAAPSGGGNGNVPILPKFLSDAGIKSFPSDMKKAFAKASAFHMAKARKSVAGDIAALPAFYQGLANGTLDKAKPGITKKAAEYAKNMTFTGGSDSNKEHWRSMVAQALKISGIGGGKSDEDLWLQQIMEESSGNPRLVQSSALQDINVLRGDPARGLVQVPKITWDDFGKDMGPFFPNVYNPLKNLIVGMRDANAKYHPWQDQIRKPGGYADGTDSADPGLALTGEDGPELLRKRASDQFWSIVGQDAPELLKFRGGEQVMSTPETRAVIPNSQIQAAASGGSFDYKRIGQEVAAAVVDNLPPSLVVNNDNAGLIEDRIAKKTVQQFADHQAMFTANI